MSRLLKPRVKERTDYIKSLLFCKAPFEKELGALYTDLRLAGRHAWTAEVYRLLLLCADDTQKEALYHPALLQAFMSLGEIKQARTVARRLLKRNPADPETRKLLKGLSARAENALPPYTPVASLSRYAGGKKSPHSGGEEVLPEKWKKVLTCFTAEKLRETGYFAAQHRLQRAPRAFRTALTQTFDELASCLLLHNYRAVAVLAGSMLETLLALYVRKKLKIRKISALGARSRDIFDLNLHDLTACCAAHGLLETRLLKLIGAVRVQRNFIHPGKELLEQNGITPAGARVCFLAVLEMTDKMF